MWKICYKNFNKKLEEMYEISEKFKGNLRKMYKVLRERLVKFQMDMTEYNEAKILYELAVRSQIWRDYRYRKFLVFKMSSSFSFEKWPHVKTFFSVLLGYILNL